MRRSLSLIRAVVIFAAAFTASVDCKRIFSSSRHTYPAHAGHSGHGSHGGAPAGGFGPHGSPASGGAHSYPHSPGLSGNSHPGSHSHLGSHPHPSVYSPPQQIHYSPAHGAPPAHPYPVYHGSPPVYVNQIHDSGSKFSTILAGLALYNLGRSAAGGGGHGSSHAQEKDNDGESCALRIVQDMNVERVKIPCYIVSTFTETHNINTALANKTESTTLAPAAVTTQAPSASTSIPVTTVAPPSNESVENSANTSVSNTSSTSVNNTSSISSESASSEVKEAATNVTVTAEATVSNNTNPVEVPPTNATMPTNTTIASNNTVVTTPEPVDALKVKGDPVELKKDARCFVERKTKTSSSTKEIECGLLQQYALQSLQRQQHPRRSSAVSSTLMSQFSVCTLSVIVYLVQ